MPRTVAVTTLGCKVNQYESAALATLFRERGYKVVDFSEPADIYVINTCTVTHLGDRKSRQLIRRATRNNPHARVVVTGCYAQTSPEEVLSIPGVDLVVGTRDKSRIVDLVEELEGHDRGPLAVVRDVFADRDYEELPVPALPSRVRAFLKIQEGCNNYCAYCIIPFARGPLRSRDPENVLAEAGRLVAWGFKELVLTGIHTGAYGQDRPGGPDLAGLVERLAEIPGLVRLRLSSVEPMDITDKLVDIMATRPNVCRHLHIPLQSGDDTVLARMRRHYTTAWFRELVQRVRGLVPGIAITTDIIVGFPGETDGQFENTFNFVREMAFARLHVFKYSPRQGTAAASFPDQISAPVKEARSRRLIALGDELARSFAAKHIGQEVQVLVEEELPEKEGFFAGLTDNYLRVIFPARENPVGELVTVRVEGIKGGDLKGMII
ncbi:tRNA (N(6)-L-threonylcarbamoyladenosine(37)-C(2))-methylthiotransferase MtaB [Desulfofundulus thermosubterraneus]|uniref:Threonylcarbamoyladenosine tRNA methylthiotransferase MtaB n=1 Tax=Desulfofundulus thermosubterraneus DSM 16057 TaxID=1121432 RepID=A0A1M6ABM3_9FIRM|nr:tRNA (N(6)-L-threonylcarbamoyladenosine(37)-C(2))-methylthiotransferase MtaB [Desulfofundulus thermosubterraneus]SHI33563.1 threonylcarbamoyladenosine tRNA methylthiotransferase MtaB [Desulfofundulus thermosubterraneus DSM 16057]